MSHPVIRTSRRHLLKLACAAPLLPLAGGQLAIAAAPRPSRRAAAAVSFSPTPAPTLAQAQHMAQPYTTSEMLLHYAQGASERFALDYHSIFVTGDEVPDGKGGKLVAGGYYDIHQRPIIDTSTPSLERQFFSDSPDGSSLITLKNAQVPGIEGKAVFAVVQFEYATRNQAGQDDDRIKGSLSAAADMYGKLPSPVAVLTLDQNPATGALKLVKYHNVDTSGVHGLWITCGASLSPWNTHLGSEEYEPDAALGDPYLADFSRNLFGDAHTANPYHYGHLPEVSVHPDGTGSVKKHYCLGRISHELIQVMPDERTALMGDDATNGGLFMFVADRPADLSAGTLYAAQWHQTSGTGPGAATLGWIKLGHARSDDIRALVDGGIKAADIMDVKKEDPQDASYTRIPFNGKSNWVKLQPGMEQAAAFLETHRYAALMGASMGFSKMEGTTVNARDKVAYSAMSYIYKSMLDGSGGIKVQGPKAGAVYALPLRGGQRDHSGAAIVSDWVPVSMSAPAALVGEDLASPDALGNTAAVEKIANPDNIKFDEAMRTLFIGEDSAMHVNNFLWAYNVDSGQLVRILSVPAGAESTGLHAISNINGWTYIMSNFQHAGDWESPLHDKVKAQLDPLVRQDWRNRFGASVGYLSARRVA